MKYRVLVIALAVMAGASFSTAKAEKKSKKSKKAAVEQQAEKACCRTLSEKDTLSYATGQMLTRGLMEYITEQLKVDTAYMDVFYKALEQSLVAVETPEQTAKEGGLKVANMVKTNMLPQMKQRLGELNLPFNEEVFKRGFLDAVGKDTTLFTVDNAAAYHDKVTSVAKEKQAEELIAVGKAFLEENGKKADVKTLPSGLQYKVIRQGDGPVAEGDEKVTVKYEGRLLDGTVFDSSYKRNPQTTTFSPRQVIKGWTEALYLMPEGSEWELYIPQHLAYGDRPAGKIPPYSTLIFKIEVVKVEKAVKQEEQPAEKDVKTVKKPVRKAVRSKK